MKTINILKLKRCFGISSPSKQSEAKWMLDYVNELFCFNCWLIVLSRASFLSRSKVKILARADKLRFRVTIAARVRSPDALLPSALSFHIHNLGGLLFCSSRARSPASGGGMPAVEVHQLAQCITCHAWNPDRTSKLSFISYDPESELRLPFCLSFTLNFLFMPEVRSEWSPI